MYRLINNTVGTLSLGATTFAAAVYDEWPPYIAGAALGTVAFLWSIKGAAEDRRYKALTKRLDESEAQIDANRRDRLQLQEFYSTRITEIEEKHRQQIAELEQAKLQIMLDLQTTQERMKRELAARVSEAKTVVAVEAATVKSALSDPSAGGPHI